MFVHKTRAFFNISTGHSEDMPVAEDAFLTEWKRCNGIPRTPRGKLDVRIKSSSAKWPDALECDNCVPFAISEKVLNDLIKAGINLDTEELDLHLSDEASVPPPKYFYICAPQNFDMEVDSEGDYAVPKVKPETWPGADFGTTEAYPKLLFCSFQIVKLARENAWTNFQFNLPRGLLSDEADVCLDHLSPAQDWPPSWLSKHFDLSSKTEKATAFRRFLQSSNAVCLGHPVTFDSNIYDEYLPKSDLKILDQLTIHLFEYLKIAANEVCKYVNNDAEELQQFYDPTITFFDEDVRGNPNEWAIVLSRYDWKDYNLFVEFHGTKFHDITGVS